MVVLKYLERLKSSGAAGDEDMATIDQKTDLIDRILRGMCELKEAAADGKPDEWIEQIMSAIESNVSDLAWGEKTSKN